LATLTGPRFRRQAIDPFAGGDGLACGLVGAERCPIPFLLVLFIRNRSFDDKNEGRQFAIGRQMERAQEIFADIKEKCTSIRRLRASPLGEAYSHSTGYAERKTVSVLLPQVLRLAQTTSKAVSGAIRTPNQSSSV